MAYQTAQQKQQEAEKFLAWLRRKYPANGAVIRTVYRNTPQLKKGIEAYVYQYSNYFKFELAVDRDMRAVLRSVAHEYEHVRQVVNEKIPMTKFKGKHEMAAWGFAMHTIPIYQKEFGINL